MPLGNEKSTRGSSKKYSQEELLTIKWFNGGGQRQHFVYRYRYIERVIKFKVNRYFNYLFRMFME